MSLFTLRDVWSFHASESGSTNFSVKSMCIANIDNDPNGMEKVILGSYSGLLRIVSDPLTSDDDDGSSDQKGNLLAEFYMGSPILQVSVGYFVGGSTQLHLAILQPQKLGVYGFSKLAGQVEHGSQYKVTLLYEHQLKRHAFNMCVGPFGQSAPSLKIGSGMMTGVKPIKTRDFMCVQSLDGTLSFFEQEVFSFSRYLPDFLLPGPITFLPYVNSFVTVTSSWELQCFRYSALAMSKDDATRQTEETTVGKRLTPDWIFSIGEEPIGDIEFLTHPTLYDDSRIVIMTFRLLFCFSGNGELQWSKRLDISVNCFTSFLNSSNECITIVASGSELGTLYIYNGTCLKWAAKIAFSPSAIGRIRIQNVPGGILLLSGDGQMNVSVLGTEPSLFIAPPIQSRELDYEAAEKELLMLRKIIAEAGEQNITTNKESTVDIKVEFEGQKTVWVESTGLEAIALIATVKILCRVRVNDVRISIYTSNPIVCSQPSVYIGDIVGRHSYSIEFYAGNEAIPSDLQCEVNLFYMSDLDTPHFIQKSGIKIPLFIITKSFHEIDKQGECKLTFALNKPVLNLMTLYNDFDWNAEINSSSLTLLLHGGEKVTILASTKANTDVTSRYRIQSDSMAGIHLILRDFLDRLQRKYGREKSAFEVTLAGEETEIPLLNEYFNEIDAHIVRRRRELQIKEDVAGRAAQLRAIQRRLLIRFRDKNTLPMTELETLLEGSLEQIMDALNFMEQNEIEKEKNECRLSGATRLILELCRLQSGRSMEELSILSNALCPFMWGFSDESGWEECVYTGLSFIKTQQIVPLPSFEQMDSNKLKKLIKSTLDKFKKSSSSLVPVKNEKAIPSTQEPDLMGNVIVERMMSARSRTDRRRKHVLAVIPEPTGEEIEDENKEEGNTQVVEAIVENELKSSQHRPKNSLILHEETNDLTSNGSTVLINNNNNPDEEPPDDGFW